MNYLELVTRLFASWNVSEGVITHVFALRGYHRQIALGKPGLSPDSQKKRLKFAEEHVKWTTEQWGFHPVVR